MPVGRVAGGLLVVLAASLPLAPASAAPGTAGERPNIVVFLTDDQRFDALGLLHPVLETPHLDQLAAEGVRFSRAFATSPICPASRASLLTGLYEQRHGFTFATPPLAMQLLHSSYPRLLRDTGYSSVFIGKDGADLAGERAELLFDRFLPVTRTPYIQVRDGVLGHETDYIAGKAAQFIASHTGEQPFVLTLWFNAPHADDADPMQFVPPTRYDSLYAGIDFPAPATSDPAFFQALPTFLRESENRVRWHWRWNPRQYNAMMARYLAMIRGIDDAVGLVRAALAARGASGNTVLVFTSDNGFFVGERGFADKWLGYDVSTRIPLLVLDPRLPSMLRGRVLDPLVLNVDLAPTIVELAGQSVPAIMQGHSLVPWLEGATPDWRSDFYLEHSFSAPPAVAIARHRSVRTERYKYIHYHEHDREELYDLWLDPDEADDLAAEPAMQATLLALRARTLSLQAAHDTIFAGGFQAGGSP